MTKYCITVYFRFNTFINEALRSQACYDKTFYSKRLAKRFLIKNFYKFNNITHIECNMIDMFHNRGKNIIFKAI